MVDSTSSPKQVFRVQHFHFSLLAQMLAQPIAMLDAYDDHDPLARILFCCGCDLLEEVLVPALPPLLLLWPVERVLEGVFDRKRAIGPGSVYVRGTVPFGEQVLEECVVVAVEAFVFLGRGLL